MKYVVETLKTMSIYSSGMIEIIVSDVSYADLNFLNRSFNLRRKTHGPMTEAPSLFPLESAGQQGSQTYAVV